MTGIARRRLLAAGGAAAAIAVVAGVRRAADVFAPVPDFEPVADPAGFRRISGGTSSLSSSVFAGLDGPPEGAPDLPVAEVRADLCTALFGEGFAADGPVPVASFSDYYCPYCRVQTRQVAELADRLGDGLRVEWHELPLLGDASLLAAKAALAAKRQGAYLRFHEHLLGTPFRATRGYLEALSAEIGISYAELKADMESDDVRTSLQTSAALAEIFGIVGTPALVIGRTIVQGQTGLSVIEKIVALERDGEVSRVC